MSKAFNRSPTAIAFVRVSDAFLKLAGCPPASRTYAEDEDGMMKRIVVVGRVLPAMAMALTLEGCGSKPAAQVGANYAATRSNSTPENAAVAFDPCSVLTADEVTAAISDRITQTKANDHSCEYHAGPNDTDGTRIMIYKTGATEQMQGIRKANQLLAGIGSAVSSQGAVGKDVQVSITPPADGDARSIGEETIWEPNAVLAVRKGDLFVQVTPPVVRFGASGSIPKMLSDTDKRTISQKLAEATLTKLGH